MSVGKSIRAAVYERDGNVCLFCGTGVNLTLDHIQPKSKGGKTVIGNLQTLCQPCNLLKGDSLDYDPANPPKKKKRRKLISTDFLGVPLPRVAAATKNNTLAKLEPVKSTGVLSHRDRKAVVSLKFVAAETQVLPYVDWSAKLSRNFPYAYSLVAPDMWRWIYDNTVVKPIK